MPKTKIKLKWKELLIVGGLALSIGLSTSALVSATRQEKTLDVAWTNYKVAGLTEQGKIDTSIKETIVSDLLNAEKVVVDMKDDANLSIVLEYYNEDKQYLPDAKSTAHVDDFEAEAPDGAKYVRFLITPKSDEDGEITYAEMLKYISQFTATVNK